MPFREYAHNFGVVTAATAAQFSIEDTFKGNPNVPSTAHIAYAIIRNSSTGAVTVLGNMGQSVVGIGERKRIEFPFGTRFFIINPAATTGAGEVTADIGMQGVTL